MNSKSISKNYGSLETLSKADCAKAYKALKVNADVLFSTAKDASFKGNYGVARSLMILGSEEYIKGAILFLKSIGVNAIRIPEVSSALSNSHKRRHEAAMLLKLLNVILHFTEWKKFDSELDIKSSILTKFFFYAEQIGDKVKSALEELEDILWWEQADNYKNNGLYVGFNSQLLLPQNINRKDFEVAANRVEKLVRSFKTFQVIIESSSKEERTQIIRKLNDAIKIQINYDKEKQLKKFNQK